MSTACVDRHSIRVCFGSSSGELAPQPCHETLPRRAEDQAWVWGRPVSAKGPCTEGRPQPLVVSSCTF